MSLSFVLAAYPQDSVKLVAAQDKCISCLPCTTPKAAALHWNIKYHSTDGWKLRKRYQYNARQEGTSLYRNCRGNLSKRWVTTEFWLAYDPEFRTSGFENFQWNFTITNQNLSSEIIQKMPLNIILEFGLDWVRQVSFWSHSLNQVFPNIPLTQLNPISTG